MNNVKENNKYILFIISIALLILIFIGVSYSRWLWNSPTNESMRLNTSKPLKDYIVYDEGNSKFIGDLKASTTFQDGIYTTISIKKTLEAQKLPLSATINLNINSIGQKFKTLPGLKWVVTEGESTELNPTVLREGNFIGTNAGDVVKLYNDIEVLTTEKKYTIWLWIDKSENTYNELTGEVIDTTVWTQIDQMAEAIFEITNLSQHNGNISATVINNQANITHYSVTAADTTSPPWEAIPANEIGNTYNLEKSVASTGAHYVWFKDSNNKVIKKSIIVTFTYNINYYDVGGTAFSGTHAQHYPKTYNYGTGVTLDTPTKVNYSFAGYYLNQDGTGNAIASISDTQGGDINLYAKWNIKSHIVTYDYITNGGTSLSGSSTESVLEGANINLSYLSTSEKEGYEFVGWSTDPNAHEVLTSLKMGTHDITLYAIFKKQVVITFYRNGAKYIDNSTNNSVIRECTIWNKGNYCSIISPSITANPGYKVVGYDINSTSQTSIWDANTSLLFSGDENFYAITIDDTPPTGTIQVALEESTSTIHVNVNATDTGSGIKNYGYLLQTSSVCPSDSNSYLISVNNIYNFYNVESGNYYVCVKVTDNKNNSSIITSNVIEVINELDYSKLSSSYHCANGHAGSQPYAMNYTGNCSIIDDGYGNYRIKFLTSGTLTFNQNVSSEFFLVGGGGSGGKVMESGCGGGGGYIKQGAIAIAKGNNYNLTVGSGGIGVSQNGEDSVIKKGNVELLRALGGIAGQDNGGNGGSGGAGRVSHNESGLAGGSNGSDGSKKDNSKPSGIGSHQTTREFGEDDGDLYAGGGGSGGWFGGEGGEGGGGHGADACGHDTNPNINGTPNTGGGGGGASNFQIPGNGGSGIIILRNQRIPFSYHCENTTSGSAPYFMNYTGNCKLVNVADNYHIRLLTNGNLTFNQNYNTDVFLVGGGEGGGGSTHYGRDDGTPNATHHIDRGAGGEGGKVYTKKGVQFLQNSSYTIVIGTGGAKGEPGHNDGRHGGLGTNTTISGSLKINGQNYSSLSSSSGSIIATTGENGQLPFGDNSCGDIRYGPGGGNGGRSVRSKNTGGLTVNEPPTSAGETGGGAGGIGPWDNVGGDAKVNSGGGGGGAIGAQPGGLGGSGIVIIRAQR